MIRDITLGQYYPADSILHKLDPRVKLVATISFLVALFLINSWVGYLVATVFLVSMIRLSKVPFRFIVQHGSKVDRHRSDIKLTVDELAGNSIRRGLNGDVILACKFLTHERHDPHACGPLQRSDVDGRGFGRAAACKQQGRRARDE